MDRIQPVQRAHEVCAPDGASHARDTSVDPDLSDHAIWSRGEKSRSLRDVSDNCDGALFASHRARLCRIAHRILGSRADAEDLVQDVYLRWHQSAKREIASPIAFLVTITRRLCLDRLRELKQQRAKSPDPPLPESVIEDPMPSPEMQIELIEEVSVGFLAVLERLGPEERIAFLLHDVFDYDYEEVGRILSSTQCACRQIVHRARARLRDSRARFAVTPECHERVLRKFIAAIGANDRQAVMALLAEEVELPPRGCHRR